MRGLFITGTDTGVGKTFVTTAIIRALRDGGCAVGAYKPVVSGSEQDASDPHQPAEPRWADLEGLADAVLELDAQGRPNPGLTPDLTRTELLGRIGPQRFVAPLAPPVAARLEGTQVDAGLLRSGVDWWRDRAEVLLVEGAGGLLSPVTETESVADLARDLGFPVLIVARLGLGTINHTLLTVEVARARGLSVVGVVLNEDTPAAGDDLARATNPAEIAHRCPVPILAVFPYCGEDGLRRAETFRRMNWNQLI